ncbi:MAG: hemerythrin domain-containing protein [Clostridiales bacterium]|nr:hemerythrin domain-containing protein [Clostridiales bacterium]
MNIENLKRQHSEIMDIFNEVKGYIKNGTIEGHLDEIVKGLNTISGKLKIHLLNEDRYLYPKLLNSNDIKHNNFGKKYIDEMMEVTNLFSNFKIKYNTSSKIKSDIQGFIKETNAIYEVLLNRIDREERELYKLIKD